MTPSKPYLIRALYEWLLDNEVTPYILVDASHADLQIPPGIADDGKVVLNLAPGAVQELQMTNEYLSFSARFNSIAHDVYCPMQAVFAIYARENGEGMMFQPEEAESAENEVASEEADTKPKRPGLTVVK